MKTRFHTAALAAALLALAAPGFAADKVDSSDEKFIKSTAAGGMAEMTLADLATKKAERSDVKEFALMLVTEHTALNNDLKVLAERKGVEVSAIMEPKAAEKFQALEKDSGRDFDKAFLKDMKADHEKTISDFEAQDKSVQDPDLKAFIEKSLPGLKEHLNKANSLLGK